MAAYGCFPPGRGAPLAYGDYVGLLLNVDRARLLASVDFARGYVAARDPSDLGREWADALAADPLEVDEIEFAINKARAAARRQHRWQQGGIQGLLGGGR